LLQRIAAVTRSDPRELDPESSFAALALDSVAAVEVMANLDRLGLTLAPDAFYRHNTPSRLAEEIWRLAQASTLRPLQMNATESSL
jgi:acyl carrier protein